MNGKITRPNQYPVKDGVMDLSDDELEDLTGDTPHDKLMTYKQMQSHPNK